MTMKELLIYRNGLIDQIIEGKKEEIENQCLSVAVDMLESDISFLKICKERHETIINGGKHIMKTAEHIRKAVFENMRMIAILEEVKVNQLDECSLLYEANANGAEFDDSAAILFNLNLWIYSMKEFNDSMIKLSIRQMKGETEDDSK